MKNARWQIIWGISLVSLSALLYFAHFIIFGDAHHIFIYLLGDIAFVPVEVLIVTMIIHKLLEEREKRARLEKLNVVIEIFFSKVGTDLVDLFSSSDSSLDSLTESLIITNEWTDRDFIKAKRDLKNHNYSINIDRVDLQGVNGFLHDKKDFLLQLLANPTMLEHETFTDLIRAVLHLSEELLRRNDLSALPDTDKKHLAGDLERAYGLLVLEWLECMKYLKSSYPYLFSLAMRTNPFDSTASPFVR